MKRNLLSYWIILLLLGFAPVFLQAQSGVFNPNDPVLNYDSTKPPVKPAFNQVGKWVRTPKVSWNTTSFKCYYYNGIPFRLKFPKNYDSTKRYPVIIFFNGDGEYGRTPYDNEYHLALGGQVHMGAVDNGKFNGFLLYPQSQSPFWYAGALATVRDLIEKVMVPMKMVDPFRVYIDGLSAGGQAVWQFLGSYSTLVAAATPISAASPAYYDSVKKYRFTPVWHFQGGQDPAPTPATSHSLGTKILSVGSNYKYKEFPSLGHSCWNESWADTGYFSFYNAAHKANPWALYGRTDFCDGEAISDTLGVSPGFNGYEWRKDGVLIPGANTYYIVATDLGTYDCRVKKGTEWSVWSPTPVVIKRKYPTVQPAIKVSGLASRLIPAPDSSNGVLLEVPDGYKTYTWQKVGSSTTISTNRVMLASTPGNYQVRVTVPNECPANSQTAQFSNPFTVLNANGPSGPPPVSNLTTTTLSKTSIKLAWSQVATPTYNETGFEIYRNDGPGTPTKLVVITAANASNATFSGLIPGTLYTFKVRAINDNAASSVVTAGGSTQADVTAPTVPGSLHLGTVTKSSVELIWNSSTDDVGVVRYDIYINGNLTYAAPSARYIAYNLLPGTNYSFAVKARDAAGNTSAFSNTVTASTLAGTVKIDTTQVPKNNGNFSIYLNFNMDNAAKTPWNNTNVFPSAGTVFRNLYNYQGNLSGVNVTIVNNFSGYNPDGMNTGNNSGVYPDNVLRSSYYCDKGITARLMVDGLPVNYTYSFIFLGSRNGTGNRTTIYTIGNAKVSLNASLNTKNTVKIDNVITNNNGQVYIDISLDSLAQFAYINSLVIKAYCPASVSPSSNITRADALSSSTTGLSLSESASDVTAYPNPFINNVTVSIPIAKKVGQMTLKLTDVSGRIIMSRQYKNVPEGLWQQSLTLSNEAIEPGMYLLSVSGLPDNKTRIIKLIRKK